MANPGWSDELTWAIGDEVTRRRVKRKWSAQQLADRTAELGHAVSVTIVANLANRKRRTRLTVPDWLVLAAALEVPPVLLLTPALPAEEVEVMPGWSVPSMRAYYWITGDGFSPGSSKGEVAETYIRTANAYTAAVLTEGIERAARRSAELSGADDSELSSHDGRVTRAGAKVDEENRFGRITAEQADAPWVPPEDLQSFRESLTKRGPAAGDGDG